jgi:hypothetical protein
MNFKNLVEAFLVYIEMDLVFIFKRKVVLEKILNLFYFSKFGPAPGATRGIGSGGDKSPEITIYVHLVPKILHIKFEKSWKGSYQAFRNV